MQTQTLKRYLTYSLLVASFMLPATSAKAQERRAQPVEVAVPIVKIPCPKPFPLTITATTPNVVAADFTPAQLGPPLTVAWLGDNGYNKKFPYTFQWKRPGRCCEITRAVLTVKMESTQPGTKDGYDAYNDTIDIRLNTNWVLFQPVYGAFNSPLLGFPAVGSSFPVGQPSTKQWILPAAVLNNINQYQRLSIYVQDDTMVKSATLQIWGCCLSTPQGTGTEETSPIDSPN